MTVPAAATSVRAAIVGAGLMGRWHAHAIDRVGSRVVAIVDSDEARARWLAARCAGGPAIASRVGDALSRQRVDVLHVCTPLESHEAVVAAAIEAGVHVLVEKPLAPNAPITEQLHARADRRGVLLCPVHQFLYQLGVLEAQRRLPELGPVRLLDVVACSAGAEGVGEIEREQVARDILPHALALARRLVGADAIDSPWEVAPAGAGEIRAMTWSGTTSISIMVSMHARPTENSLTIRCDGGTVRANLYHGFATLERGLPTRLDKIRRPFAGAALVLGAAGGNLLRRVFDGEAAYPGLRELVARLHGAIVDGLPSPISASESIAVARARDTLIAARTVR